MLSYGMPMLHRADWDGFFWVLLVTTVIVFGGLEVLGPGQRSNGPVLPKPGTAPRNAGDDTIAEIERIVRVSQTGMNLIAAEAETQQWREVRMQQSNGSPFTAITRFCYTVLACSVALFLAVKVLAAIWVTLVIYAGIGLVVWGLVAWIRRERW